MTNEDTTADVPTSNWTLATGTKPGAREVYSPPTRSTGARIERSRVVVGVARREPVDVTSSTATVAA